MNEQQKKDRLTLLVEIGNEVVNEIRKKHIEKGGVIDEIVLNVGRLKNLVDDYASRLESYRAQHIGANLVGGDKIAAFTGTLIMRHEVIESKSGVVSTPEAALANQLFAIRVTELFVRRVKAGLHPPEITQMIYCYTNCFDHDPAMTTWTVATMTQFLRLSNVKEIVLSD